MHVGKRTAVDADAFASAWAPKLIGFFQLFIGDQAIAEALTIDILVEEARERTAFHEERVPLHLLRRALKNAKRAPAQTVTSTEAVVRAVSALPQSPRTVVALFREMSLDFKAIASVMSCDVGEVKRLLAEALLAIHQSLQQPDHVVSK